MTRDKVVEIALSQVGYIEKKSSAQLDDFTANPGNNNYTKYWRDADAWWNWKINGSTSQGNPWCACFVSWCFKKADAETLIKPFYYCPTGVVDFKNKKQWYDRKSGTPKPGDVIMFKNSNSDMGDAMSAVHVGIVERIDQSKVYTIEGNTSSAWGVVSNGGGVFQKSYLLNSTSIMGYGFPAYKEDKEEDELTQEQIQALDYITPKYVYIDDNIPFGLKDELQEAVSIGIVGYGENGFDPALSDMDVRQIVFAKRAAKS